MPIAEAFEQHGEEGFRAREAEVVGALLENADGGAIALGGGSILSRADPRRARPPRRRLAAGRRARGLAPDRPQRPAAGDQRRGRRPRCWRCACRSTRSWPTRWCRSATARSSRRALPAMQALAELPAGTKLLWAASASGEYPVFVGRRPARAAGWWPLEGPAAVSASPTRPSRSLYAERLRAACRRGSRSTAGRGREDDGRGRAGAARAGPRPG